ncbi:hypothetical protein BGZ99_004621 [Dissophora globulifera]|uniref:Ion transport domain-containing protein n=1 Tax=Dissophora globulifera TaxID=979702 RepID=A0A9P6V068_9FUNG|nr:hypothetical protein BGZ99_004621 [Dissophora globulifera]
MHSVWYFVKQDDMCSESKLVLGTSSMYGIELIASNSVSVSTSTSASTCVIKRRMSSDELKAGMYSAVLCLGMGELLLKNVVEKITFSMQADDLIINQISTSEYDINETPQSHDLRLRLHQGLEVFTDTTRGYTLLITIAIRKTIGNKPLSFKLRSLELNNIYGESLYLKDWALSGTQRQPLSHLQYHQKADTPSAPPVPVKISAFTISETESHVATLYFDNSQAYITVSDMTLGDSQSKRWPLKSAANNLRDSDCLRIAINRSGTQVAVFQSVTDSHLEDDGEIAAHPSASNTFPFTVVNVISGRAFQPFSAKRSLLRAFESHVEILELITGLLMIGFDDLSIVGFHELTTTDTHLPSFIGFGKFTSTPDGQELFISCDGLSVEIHHIERVWNRIHGISLQSMQSTVLSPSKKASHNDLVLARELTESAQGTYFTWFGDPRAASIWSMELGHMVSFIPASSLPSTVKIATCALPGQPITEPSHSFGRSFIRIASHGRFMAIARNNVVRKYLLPSGTPAGELNLSDSLGQDYTILDIWWSAYDFFIAYRDKSMHTTYLASFDIERRKMLDRWILPVASTAHSLRMCERVYTAHGPTIDIFSRHDLVKVPLLDECTLDCRQGSAGRGVQRTSPTQEYIIESGNRYQLEVSGSDDTVALVLLTSSGDQQKRWRFLAKDWRQLSVNSAQASLYPAFFLKGSSHFLVLGAEYVQLWQLPATKSDPCRLAAIHMTPASKRETSGHYHVPHLTVCPHLRHLTIDYEQDDKTTIDMLHDCLVHMGDVSDLRIMVQLYTTFEGDPTYRDYKKALLKYTVQAFLQQPTWKDSRNVLLRELCSEWETEGFEGFLKDLVQHPDFKWIPTHFTSSENAIAFGITTARDNPLRNVQFHRTLIQHCVQNAKRGGDTFFLKPILDCMPLIRENEQLSLEVIWQLAYIPVPESSRSFVLENSYLPGIARQWLRQQVPSLRSNDKYRTFTPQWLRLQDFLWKLNYDYRAVIPGWMSLLQIPGGFNNDYKTFALRQIFGPSPESKHVKDQLFIAPLAVLYSLGASADGTNPYENYDRAWRKHVKFAAHWVSQTTFENPALRAVVQHIWLLRGVDVWIARAFVHILVLTGTLILQALVGPQDFLATHRINASTAVIQVAIVASSILVSVSHHNAALRRRVNVSMRPQLSHSAVVVIASAVLQPLSPILSSLGRWRLLRVGLNTGAVALFIAGFATKKVEIVASSHLLFYFIALYKFRVFKKLSRFVDFMYRFTADIGVFLVIFALGVVAFTEVFWILLRTCLTQPCVESTTKFPDNFVKAIFTTYFFLSGRYDPVSNELDGDFSIFHVVMALYYFFTAIIMLNILIALSKSIETESWRLKWFFGRFDFVVLATLIETLTLSGRKTLAFEREVYYTATDEEILEFQRKHMQDSTNVLLDRGVVVESQGTDTPVAKGPTEDTTDDVTEVSSAADTDAATEKDLPDGKLAREVTDMRIMMAEMLRQMADLSRGIRQPKAIHDADNETQEKEE